MFKHEGNNIFLNGVKIPLNLFQHLEPEYRVPSGLVVMFYDGVRRNYRTKTNSWSIPGIWEDGERYLSRIEEYKRLLNQVTEEEILLTKESIAAVEAVKKQSEPDLKAKYPVEEQTNVELQQRDDIKPKRVKRVRSTSKRSPRTGN